MRYNIAGSMYSKRFGPCRGILLLYCLQLVKRAAGSGININFFRNKI